MFKEKKRKKIRNEKKRKRALLSAPALGLPDITKPFYLYFDKQKEIAKEVLTQNFRAVEMACDVFVQKTRPSHNKMATLPAYHCGYNITG